MIKITVVGVGYVGLSNAVLLSQKNNVIALDQSKEKVDAVNARKCPIKDPEIESFFKNKKLNLTATTDKTQAYENANFVIIATPTDYDAENNYFDTSSVETVIEDATRVNAKIPIIIKSTIPVGFVNKMRSRFETNNIIFSPEFLREGRALYDNLNPSRIVIGDKGAKAKEFSELLSEGAESCNIPVVFTEPNEAEAIKLFANTYLAMRVAFFNELDNYALKHNINVRDIINGVCFDPRIGNHYNNPSFGYGGYCLPKDTKQLLANFESVPQNLIKAIVESNQTRQDFLVDQILSKGVKTVGVYRLIMKANSDNFRQSSVYRIMTRLDESGVRLIIHEPLVSDRSFDGYPIVNDLTKFKETSDIILANRMSVELEDVALKVFTRDVFGEN